MADSAPGRVVTFYSYKGGTGRSMALANVAWLLALSGRRVLTIDWDLEAPGLHRYFHPFMNDPSQTATEGLLDFALGIADIASAEPELETRPAAYFAQHARLDTFIEPLDCEFLPKEAELALIGPGRQGPAYSQQLGLFNWHQFYSKLRGRQFLNAAMARLRSQYDYILIDSRTGVSDTAGICTVHLPDVLVVCFTLNDQSILGASGVADFVRGQRADDERARRFRVLPVASRVEILSEHDKRQTALTYARNAFSSCFHGMSEREQETYWGQTQLAYFPFYAFEEIPAVFGDDPRAEFSLMTSVRRLAAHITGSEVKELGLDAAERKSALQRYLRSTDHGLTTAAESLVEHSTRQELDALRLVLLRLVRVEGGLATLRRTPTRTLPAGTEIALRDLQQAGIALLSRDESGEHHATLSDAALLADWPRLAGWIRDDLPFMIRRQNLDTATEAWLRAHKDEGALLRGSLLSDASELARTRPGDLNALEREFIEMSSNAESRSDVEMETNHLLSLLHVRLATLSALGALAAVLLLPVTIYGVFWVSVETVRHVEAAADRRNQAQHLAAPLKGTQQAPVPAVATTNRPRAIVLARPAAKSADEKAKLRREHRRSGLMKLLSSINAVSIQGIPILPPISLNAAFLFAAVAGTGLPLLLTLTIVVMRHLVAWRATQPLRQALERPKSDGSTRFTLDLMVRRLDAMIREYRYPDALGTPVIGTPSLAARLAMLCLVATALYGAVLTILAWRGRELSTIPPVTGGVLATATLAGAWFYSRGSSSALRMLSNLGSRSRESEV